MLLQSELSTKLAWHVQQSHTRTVEDFLARRTRALLLDARASAQQAPAIAEALGALLGWSPETRAHQVATYQALAKEYYL